MMAERENKLTNRKLSNSGDRDTLEDIIVELYKRKLEIDENKKKRTKRIPSSPSPYQQNVAPENHSLLSRKTRQRPMSAKPSSRRQIHFSTEKHSQEMKDDVYSSSFASDSSDSEKEVKVEKQNSPPKRVRAKSAQIRRRLDDDEVPLSPSHDLTIPLFKRQPYTITCNAYKNGSLDNPVRLTAPNIKQLLESATVKLELNAAARRLFLADGSEVFRPRDVAKDADVFISKGEPFKDCLRTLKHENDLRSESMTAMRLKGNQKRRIKPPTSKRLHQLVGKHTKRIVVFANGNGKESHEVVFSEQHGFARFLDDCTSRLHLPVSAKVVYDWNGNTISSIDEVEAVDHSFFKTPSVVYGPVWVSKHEGFSPNGPMTYIEETISNIRSMIRSAKQCRTDLELIISDRKDKVSNPAIKQLNKNDAEETLEKVNEDIHGFKDLLRKYKEMLDVVSEHSYVQDAEGHDYVMKHIKKIEVDDRLVGNHGLKIKIYENGVDNICQEVHINMREIQRGSHGGKAEDDKSLVRARFLEALTSWHKPIDPSGPARSVVVKRIFDENGNEIQDVLKINNDDKVWLSYGEDFRPLFSPALTLTVEKVSAVTMATEEGEKYKVFREMLDVVSDMPRGAERSSQWEVNKGFPRWYNFLPLEGINPVRKSEIERSLQNKEYSIADCFVANKLNETLVLKPKLQIDQKTSKNSLWPKDAQTWLINQSGQIYSRAFTGVALSLDTNQLIRVKYKNGDEVDGFAVTLQKKSRGNQYQEWGFTASGHIHTLQGSEQVLTYLDASCIANVEDLTTQTSEVNRESGFSLTPATRGNKEFTNEDLLVSLIVTEKFPYKDDRSKYQRWAVKQESLASPSQWKHTKVANPKWKKQAYSWPVLPDGNWNKDYEWPLEGVLLSNVPAPNRRERKQSEDEVLRLKVYQNGEKNNKRFVYLVAPDLSNMQKDQNKPRLLKFRRQKIKVDPEQIEKEKRQIEDLELNLFLERATSLLDLRFAARRLFDETGKEIHSLRGLKRHQVVCVSVGEAWIDPRMTKAEHQRRQLLAKLTNDVAMIKAFCLMRNPLDFVLDLKSGTSVGSKLFLRKCSLSQKEREEFAKGELEKLVPEEERNSPENSSIDTLVEGLRSAHAQSHMKSDKKMQQKKYPWQQNILSESVELDGEVDPTKSARSTKSEGKSKKMKLPGSLSQKFILKDGFISPASNDEVVFGVVGLDLDNIGSNVEVELCRKSIDDPAQQWEFVDDGFICLKCNRKLVLGISLPPYKSGSDDVSKFEESTVTVQHLRHSLFGRAHQKFLWDPVTSFIHAFQTQTTDKEITAANHVSICTHAVSGPEVLSQEGFIVDVPGNSPSDPTLVCSSCAKVLRGIYRVTKAPEKWSFSCAMGQARKSGMKQRGSFAFLNGKVDLSTYEAETTLHHWSLQLEKLHQESSLRLLNREIHANVPIQACRVLARRNGEGRLRAGELVIGTSISGILEQCTQRLALGSAARRLYTADGMHILHMEQLIEWATANFYQSQQDNWNAMEMRDSMFEREEPEGNFNSPNIQPDETNLSTEGTPDHVGNEVKLSEVARKLRPPSGKMRKDVVVNKSESPPSEVPLSVILRYPIEVWVSCGENFVPPVVAERLVEESLMGHMKRNADNLQLDTQKHVLRHMQGRRFKEMSPRELKATRSSEYPILLEGGWQETTKSEAGKLEEMNRLSELLLEQRPPPAMPRTKGINFSRELYKQPNKKRVMVYQKGESIRKSVFVWGESIGEILADATVRLGMYKDAKSLYNEEGSRITSFDVIERDCLLCVTSGETLKGRPKQSNMKMKANWAKVRKQKGPQATDIKVSPTLQDPMSVSADPFGPTGLTGTPAPPSVAWEISNDD